MNGAPVRETARLAGVLLGRAIRTFRVLPAAERGPSLAALDAFLAAPGPARFLAAVRVLGAAARELRLRSLIVGAAERSYQRGHAALAAVPGLPPELLAELRDLPVDAKAGARLSALAALLTVHQELAGRVEAGRLARLRALTPPPAPSPGGRTRKQPRA